MKMYLFTALIASAALAQAPPKPAPGKTSRAKPAAPKATPPRPPAETGKTPIIDAKPAVDHDEKKDVETIHYSVNWPSGLSLGEATLTFARVKKDGAEQLESGFAIDAAVPAFALRENVSSQATAQFCSLETKRTGVRGRKPVNEKTVFDASRSAATRSTGGGGKTEMNTPACARDSLSYLAYLRRELASGRLPASQKVYHGGPYDVRVEYMGTETVRLADTLVESDRLRVNVKGPASETTAEMLFARDAVRTPVVIRVPLALGKFSLEIVR